MAEDADAREARVQALLPTAGATPATTAPIVRSAVVNFTDLARHEALGVAGKPPVRPLLRRELEEPAEPAGEISPGTFAGPIIAPLVASPSPGSSFMGLDDIPMVDSSYIVIPPDVSGAVGPTRTFEGHNNNYRVLNKSDGSVVATVGTATFWNPVIVDKNLLAQLTDPRTTYDPVQNRWIVAMQTVNLNGLILIGVSQTSDPAGSWYLYAFGGLSASYLIDFPTLGFNKNWIAVGINRYSSGGAFQRGVTLVANYAQARAGTLASATIFTQATNTHFVHSPCVTYSATEETLFVVTHLSSAGASYAVDVITGTPASPAYTTGGSLVRPGGGWVQPGGNLLPQSAPVSGASSCSPPCTIETQDSQVRSAPVYRNGFLYYSQTIGLPSSGLTHTGVQWTKLTPSLTAAFADGGRIEDPTATSTNGGKWYAFTHLAVNSVNDILVGYSQFSSAQHPAAGYSYHDHTDSTGTTRDPLIYKLGQDYYHKDFGGGRNRWGDFSAAAVDPSDDQSLWVLQEYAKTRVSTNDGTTGSNGSRWSTWWANVAGPAPTVTIAAGPSQNEGNAGNTAFVFTVNLSTGYSLPVTVNYQTADGSATVADNDYQAASSSIVIPAGNTSGTITVSVVGDVALEPNETFTVTLTGATNGTIGAPATSTGTILNDDVQSFTITASAGAGGSISPSGAVSVAAGDTQSFTITPNACHHVANVLVDGSSVGAVTSYSFNNVQASHTIAASFAADGPFTITASAGAGGSISPSGAVSVACGDGRKFTIAPDTCHTIADVLVDGVSVGAVATYTFSDVQAGHTIAASFSSSQIQLGETHVDASCTGVADGSIDLTVSGGVPGYTYAWSNGATTQDLSGLLAGSYTVTVTDTGGCTAGLGVTIAIHKHTITATAGANGSISPSGAVSVVCGTDTTFTITPDPSYVVDQLLVDGSGVTPAASYTFTNVTANHTIDVTFKPEVLAVGASIPTQLALSRVMPNPVTGAMHLQYGMPAEGAIRVSVLDLSGREVAVLAQGIRPAGWHTASWNGRTARGPAGAGIYFVRFDAGARTLTQRFALTR
jgi:hypothetical protein